GTPIGDELDVDYVLWGPFDSDTDFCSLDLEVDCPSCPNNTSNPNFYPFGNIVDCSYSANPYESITMEDAVQGQVYLLLVTNFEQEAGIIQITQTNFDLNDPDVGTVTGAINAVVENQDLIDTDSDGLGDEITVCQDLSVNPSVTLTANSPFADAYIWYQNGFEMEGENGPTLEVTETDNYILQVYDNQCGVYAVSQTVQVNLYNEAVPVDVPDITNCDDASNDGIGEFDLESQTAAILAGQNSDGFTVTYYSSLSDAQAGVGALSSPYTNTSNPQTIWVRVEDTNAVGSNSDCFAASNTFSFDLIISGPTPTVSEINYDVCDDGSNDGFASFDLSSQDLLVLGSQDPADFNVSYYLTENDAIAGTGALSSPYTNTVNPQTIWVRVESNASATCFSVGTMTLTVSPAPTASMVPDLGSCDSNGDTLPDFDLTMHEDTLLDGQTGMTVTYHTSQADADTGDNAIQVPSFYSSNTPATIYVRVESSPNCYNTTSFNLLEGEEPVTTITTDSDEFEICDNTTTPLILTAVPGNYNASEVSIVWYEDGMTLSGETGLTLSVLTGGYYEVEVTFNSTGCTNIVGQEVITLENCVVPQAISPNNDGKNDNFDLSAFDVQKLEIFNRYGVLVYSRTNYTNEWHGQSDSGDELPVGTYYYVMRYQGGKEKASWVYINK
ncbi:MAG: gliding motility-associated C-terminal domain-containing protein, partial [Flavobacteriaceae bacterium]|nr:gliding motility-associated C-terminal domain-containing protein [Flavobacteriaceae bacterium]HPF95975.1 gliding motility-associated C-terminal domain-containing protein [Mangrovimonas sp.]